jgi:hypothetical protein
MTDNIGERLAAVETKVGALQDSLDPMAADVRLVRDYVLAEQAKKRLSKQFFGGIAGVVAICGTLFEIFRK